MLNQSDFGAHTVYRDLGKLTSNYRGGHVIYRPSWAWRRSLDLWDRLAWHCFRWGNVVYYVDETRAVTGDSTDPPEGLSAVVQMGRERNVGCWIATQRPKRIPLNLLSECDHYFVFHLGHPADRALMAELTETPEVREVSPDEHGFWLYQSGMRGGARYFSKLSVKDGD